MRVFRRALKFPGKHHNSKCSQAWEMPGEASLQPHCPGQSQGRRDQGADFGGKGDHSLSVHPQLLCHCHHTCRELWGLFVPVSPQGERGYSTKTCFKGGSKTLPGNSSSAQGRDPRGRGTVGQGWGQLQKLGLPPDRPGCALQTGFLERSRGRRKARCKKEACFFLCNTGT